MTGIEQNNNPGSRAAWMYVTKVYKLYSYIFDELRETLGSYSDKYGTDPEGLINE